VFRVLRVIAAGSPRPYKTKAPPVLAAGLRKSADVSWKSVAQFDRPAEAGMVVPVVVREPEHLQRAYCLAAVAVKRATDAFPSGLRLSLAPQAMPPASTPIEFASPWFPPERSPGFTV
jgi:hypothetical protein